MENVMRVRKKRGWVG